MLLTKQNYECEEGLKTKDDYYFIISYLKSYNCKILMLNSNT